MSRLFFKFSNLTDDAIELFNAKIREGIVIDLQADEIEAIAIVDSKNSNIFTQFLDYNNIKTKDGLREMDARNMNGWNLK